MDFITGKHLPRRTFLRGVGATVALPFLDAMVPAGGFLSRRVTAATADRTRLICVEEVHGLAGCNNWGASQFLYAPEKTGKDFTLVADNPLKTVDAFRDSMTIVSNTDVRMAEALNLPEIGGDHFRSSAVFLTQSHPKQTNGSDLFAGTSLDQMYAQRFGQATPMPSMQFCIENLDQAGGCTYNYSCAYTDTISWASPNEPLPMIRDPRVAFDMLFGAGTSAEDRKARQVTRRSILDWVTGEVERVSKQVGAADRQRLERYLDNVRELERRIQAVEARNNSGEQRALPEAPAGVPDSFSEHMKLMFDIQVLALQTDMTRIISFKTGRDAQNRVFAECDSKQPFHPASHHGNRQERILEFNKINRFRVGQMAYFLEKMKSTMDGDASLLDKSLVIWGSPMADPNIHNHRRCPLVLFGRANGALKGNVHLKAEDGTPMANVMLTLLHTLGMDDIKQFGDSTAEFSLKA
ncbi:MAG TPA: DUF1552 domain-containing protein [Vicinamibacterales bacterium]|nr:DUF1552 domain-containing protein [Vicinamibacterales bacterium]